MSAKRQASPDKPRELETKASYQVGKTTVSIERVFRSGGSETLGDILYKLIQKEAEQT